MVEFIWRGDAPIPPTMPITQVYGVLFDGDGNILIRNDEGICGLIGGTPEQGETREQSYQEVRGDGEPYAQLRYIAKVKNVGPVRPDPDNGKTYERLFVAPAVAIKLIKYTSGDIIINSAVELAKTTGII